MGDQRTETLPEYMIRVRRDIHRHPETAWTEYRTTALVARELENGVTRCCWRRRCWIWSPDRLCLRPDSWSWRK